MRVYVASKFENTTEVRAAMDRLKELGHVITHDWTGESAGDRKGIELDEFHTECALKDMQGVQSAEAVLLIGHANGKGMWTEMGMAIAWSIPVFYCHPERVGMNVFTALQGVETFDTVEKAIEALDEFGKMAEGRA